MTRGMKTIRNLAVTAAVLAAYAWLSGGFLTPTGCVMTSMEQLGFTPCEIVREEAFGRARLYLLRSAQGLYAEHTAARGLLFWHTGGGATHIDLSRRTEPGEHGSDSWGVQEQCAYAWFVRADDTVDAVAWTATNGRTYRTSDWSQDCAMVLVPERTEWKTLTVYQNGVPVFEKEV